MTYWNISPSWHSKLLLDRIDPRRPLGECAPTRFREVPAASRHPDTIRRPYAIGGFESRCRLLVPNHDAPWNLPRANFRIASDLLAVIISGPRWYERSSIWWLLLDTYYGWMTALPDFVHRAAAMGIFAKLNAEQRFALLSSGDVRDVTAGQFLYFAEDRPQFVGLIVEGFLRVFIASAGSGRENTIRYVRPGDLLGVVAALSGPSATSVQTLRDSRMWLIDSAAFRRVAQNETRIAWLIAEECARRAAALVDEIAGSAFATVRQRIAHHLLHMAQSRPSAPYLVARITQSDLSNAAGTVREVSVRELRSLRAEGLIRPGRDGIAILDPDGLQRIAAESFKPTYGT